MPNRAAAAREGRRKAGSTLGPVPPEDGWGRGQGYPAGHARIAAMLSLPSLLSERVRSVAGVDPELRPATRPQFGHYQTNVALRLANAEGRPPREVAARLVEQIDLADVCEPLEVAGPGFINLRIRADVLARVASDVWPTIAPESASPAPPAGGGRLLGAERRETDARRAPAFDDHR